MVIGINVFPIACNCINPKPFSVVIIAFRRAGALARGDAGLFLRFPAAEYREKIWDHVAGAIIVTEAGGCITDGSGAPLNFGRGKWLDLNNGIVAAAPKLHAAVIEQLKTTKP